MSFISAAVIGGIATVGVGMIAANQAKQAAKGQVAAAQRGQDMAWDQYQQTREDQAPWREAGTWALGEMKGLAGQGKFTMADFQADPGYQFRLREGQKALERSASARGGLLSGGTGKALLGYGQGMASQEYQNAWNRAQQERQQKFNEYASMAGLGQTANQFTNQAGMNTANLAGQLGVQGANATAAGNIAGMNALTEGVGGAVNQYQQWNMLQQMQQMNKQKTTSADD